jgi:hypothetical protein
MAGEYQGDRTTKRKLGATAGEMMNMHDIYAAQTIPPFVLVGNDLMAHPYKAALQQRLRGFLQIRGSERLAHSVDAADQ